MADERDRKRTQAAIDAALAAYDVEEKLAKVRSWHLCFKSDWQFERDDPRYQRASELLSRQREIRRELMVLAADIGGDE